MPAMTTAQPAVYQDPVNLQVLPGDTSPEQLLETMRSFALDTGLRCSHCHVGEEGQPLTSFDFASDERPLKQTARTMMRMVEAINGQHLARLGESRVEVRCVTCHRGLRTPRLTAEMLAAAADEGGVDGMLKSYRSLRERYYGSHSLDFTDNTLVDFARARAAAGHADQAEAMFRVLLEQSAGSFVVHWRYGEHLQGAGDVAGAVAQYRAAIQANPASGGFLEARIEALEAAESEP